MSDEMQKSERGSLLSTVLVPVAGPEDARETGRAMREALTDQVDRIVVLHVIKKAGGAPDAASVEQMEQWASESLAAFEDSGGDWLSDIDYRAEYQFGTDIVGTILDEADNIGATVIAYTPRSGHTLLRWLSGDTAAELVDKSHLPVLAVPRTDES